MLNAKIFAFYDENVLIIVMTITPVLLEFVCENHISTHFRGNQTEQASSSAKLKGCLDF